MTGRASANLLTRTTAMLAAAFFVTSLGLAWISTGTSRPRSIIDAPAATTAPAVPQAPAEPSVPLAR